MKLNEIIVDFYNIFAAYFVFILHMFVFICKYCKMFHTKNKVFVRFDDVKLVVL